MKEEKEDEDEEKPNQKQDFNTITFTTKRKQEKKNMSTAKYIPPYFSLDFPTFQHKHPHELRSRTSKNIFPEDPRHAFTAS